MLNYLILFKQKHIMKIVVTGATGFVGTKLVERLQAAGDRIVVLARNSQKASNLFPQSSFPNVEVVSYNPLQLGDWADTVSGSDAGLISDQQCSHLPRPTAVADCTVNGLAGGLTPLLHQGVPSASQALR